MKEKEKRRRGEDGWMTCWSKTTLACLEHGQGEEAEEKAADRVPVPALASACLSCRQSFPPLRVGGSGPLLAEGALGQHL